MISIDVAKCRTNAGVAEYMIEVIGLYCYGPGQSNAIGETPGLAVIWQRDATPDIFPLIYRFQAQEIRSMCRTSPACVIYTTIGSIEKFHTYTDDRRDRNIVFFFKFCFAAVLHWNRHLVSIPYYSFT